MNVYIGEPVVVSDMQGPCPDGFHVPLNTEFEGLNTIMSGLGITSGSDYSSYLHVPFAGRRIYNTNVSQVDAYGAYWTSIANGTSNANSLALSSTGFGVSLQRSRAMGLYIRCFKNSFVLPDSNWTVIQGTLGSAGIFWNQTDGLISVTSDGSTGYTIQDKNLGATTVWNNGDSLTVANTGNVFQWGNNYAFHGTLSSDSITSQTARIDTTGYGPGNYYESSTWIKYDGRWDNPANDNLRGGVSQGSGTKSVEVKNIYIGEYKGYEYSYDFRNKTKSEAESDGWVFDSATYGFSSNGISNTGGGVGYIRYTVDISSYKTLKLSGTGTVSGTYTGISLIGGTTSVGFVNWLYRPSGLGVFYNDANHYVGSALGYGDFSWEIEIDLDTGNFTTSCSNGQTLTGTLNSSYLSALKQSNTTLGIGFNDLNGYIQTFNAQAIPA